MAQQVAKPTAKESPAQPLVQSWPIRLESPRYKIRITAYHYCVGQVKDAITQAVHDIYAWAFISAGLQGVAGGELVFVVKRRPHEADKSYPLDFLCICDTIYDQASKRRLQLRRWGLIDLDEPLFNQTGLKTIALGFRNTPLFGMESAGLDKGPIPHFYCLALNDEEVAVARTCGPVRALVSANPNSPWFPFPFYVDRDWKSSLSPAKMGRSVVVGNKPNKLNVTGLNVIHSSNGQVTLNIPKDRVSAFKEAMLVQRFRSGASLLIESEMHDSCNGVYSWESPTSVFVLAMNPTPTNIAANFLLLAFNQTTEAVRATEDGMLVLLDRENTARFFDSACSGRDTTLKPNGVSFRLSWPPSWAVPAFSNLTGSARIIYLPASGAFGANTQQRQTSHVVMDRVVFVREPTAGSASVELSVNFIKAAEAAIKASIPEQRPAALPQGCGMIANFRIPKIATDSFSVSFILPSSEKRRAVPMDEMQLVVNRLEVPEGMVYMDYIEFQLQFSCWGFSWDRVS